MTTPSQAEERGRRLITRLIFIGLSVWGLLLALGAAMFQLSPETRGFVFQWRPERGLIVLAIVGAFLGLWRLLLATRRA